MDLTIHYMLEDGLRERRLLRMSKPEPWHNDILRSPRRPLYYRLFTLSRSLIKAAARLVSNKADHPSIATSAARESV